MSTFKPGDKVRLTKDFYNRPEFKALERCKRKNIASGKDKIGTYTETNDRGQVSSGIATYMIPAALLELAEPVKVITVVVTDEMHDHKTNANNNTDLQYKVLDDHWCCKAGQIVTYYKANGDLGARFKWDGMPKTHDNVWLWWKWLRKCKPKPTKRQYTPEQIAEARDVSYRIMTTRKNDRAVDFYQINRLENSTFAEQYAVTNLIFGESDGFSLNSKTFNGYVAKIAVATCAPDDEWNDDIGIMVALCKLTGTTMPVWVKGGKTK